jgi:hypothetical protein
LFESNTSKQDKSAAATLTAVTAGADCRPRTHVSTAANDNALSPASSTRKASSTATSLSWAASCRICRYSLSGRDRPLSLNASYAIRKRLVGNSSSR